MSALLVSTAESTLHPSPPTDEELFSYFGPQQRWVLLCMTASFALSASSLLTFSLHSWVLYGFCAVLTLNLVSSAVSLCSSQNARRVSRDSHETLVTGWRPDVHPSVDVFLPTAGEPLELLLNTYYHIGGLQWPGRLRFYVLDDGARAEVEEMARAYGFTYLSRPDRGHFKKAGNLRFGFQRSTGDFIAVFDADFCPRSDYLHHLIPYMGAPDVGIVQSPQYFDTARDMGWLQRTAGATQELFYRWVQPSRDAAGASICVGTNAIYRRAGLARSGGFAQIEHSEDVHTGVNLLRAGFRTRYVPVVVAKGVCPDSFAGFMNQQYRWCTGSMSLLRSRDFHRIPMTFRQRACFWSGFLYYISTAVNVFTVHIPGLLMAVFYPSQVRPWHFVPFLAAMWIWFVLLPAVFRTRWRYEVLRVQILYSFCHAQAIFDIARGRTAGWVATSAVGTAPAKKGGGAALARKIAVVAVTWLTLMTAGCWVAFVRDVDRYGWENFWLMGLFLVGYTYLTAPLIRDLGALLLRRPPVAKVPAPAPVAASEGRRCA